MKRFVPLLIVLAVLAAGFFYYRSGKRSNSPPRNVLLITIDTLRADHLGCYGYPRGTTPNIDSWAQQGGAIFTNATTAVPLTLPSHSTIMTGEYPFVHGVRDNGGFYLDNKWNTLAEVLHNSDFKTGGFVSAFVLDRRWGIAQGFDEYFDHFELSKFKMVSLDSVQRRGDETLGQALAWLDKNKASRFFAWIHFYDPHTPYDPPEPFKSQFRRGAYGLYDGEIAYADNLIGRIRDYLQENKLIDDTFVVLMSDHGESLGEHEESAHGFFVYDATTHIPLIIWKPGVEPQRISDQVRSVDLYATICDAMGVKRGQPGPGVSLLPLIEGRALPEKLLAYSESCYPKFHYGWSELKALRTPDYKFIDAPRRELYRLSQDSRERNNLYPGERKRAALFEVNLAQMVQAHPEVAAPRAVDSDSLEKLQALGYIGSAIATVTNPNEAPADPKDKIRLYNLIKQAQSQSIENKDDEAMEKLLQVMNEDSRILEAHLLLGNLYAKKKQQELARQSYQNALKLNPDYAAAVFSLAKSYEDEKQWDAARAGFERLQQIDPRDSKAYYHLGEIALSLKDFPKALSYFRKTVDLDPTQGISINRLGACYLEMKDYNNAEKEFKKALDLNPRMPNSHFNLALIHEARNDLDGAIAQYQKELDLFPEAYPAHFNLSRLYHSKEDFARERAELEKCIQKKPEFGLAYLYLAKSLMDSGLDLDRARSLTEEGMKRNLEKQQAPFGHYLLADIYNRLGMPADARDQVRQAQKLERQ